MKQLSLLLLFCAFLFTNCKETAISPEEVTNVITTTPFENSRIKIERASANLPVGVTKIHFFDEANGICLTESGSTFNTTDRGLTWTLSYGFFKGIGCNLKTSLEVIDNQTVVVLCAFSCSSSSTRYNEIRRSSDKGTTWTTTQIKQTQLENMTLGADKVLYVLGSYSSDLFMNETHTLLTSKDAGLTWKKDSIITTFCPVARINYLSNNNLIVNTSSFDNRQILSADKGSIWTTQYDLSEFILDVWHGTKLSYYVSKDNSKTAFNVYQSTDGGANWIKTQTTKNAITHIKPLSATTAIIFGYGINAPDPGFSYTLDAGKTWTDMSFLDNSEASQLISSSFYTPKNGYIVSSKKVLYKMTLK